MGATQSSNVGFIPQVASAHIEAYFRRKMGLGKLAAIDNQLKGAPGETVTFPFWKKIGDAQEPAENDSLEVEPLIDDKFTCTVKEIGKAVGWKDKARRVSGASKQAADSEGMRQIGVVFAEKLDKDVIVVANSANVAGYVGAGATDVLTVRTLLESKIKGFGDKHDESVAVAMHSLDFLNLMNDSTAGFLKADATQPFYGSPGYQGLLLGMALFVLDTVPQGTDIASKKSFAHFIFKANPFGICYAQDMQPERDRDILAREEIMSATMWYGTLSLHAKVASDDLRVVRGYASTNVAA